MWRRGQAVRAEVTAIARLAAPVMVARAGSLVLIAVDTAMVGHAGTAELAAYGIALAPVVPVLLLGIGLVMGTVIMVAEACGSSRSAEAGAVLRSSLGQALIFGGVLWGVLQAGEFLLLASGQSAELARSGGAVVQAMAWGVPAVLLHASTSFFLEGINRALPGMLVMVAANAVNAGANWLVLFGPFAPMGAEGAALTTSVVRWLSFFTLLAYVLVAVDRKKFGLRARGAGALAGRLLRLGFPIGLTMAIESGAFTVMLVFAGWLGPLVLGAFQIGYSLIGLPFMGALGFATAASVRVASATARRDIRAARLSGWTAAGLAGLFTAIIGAALMLVPAWFAALYSSEERVLGLAIPAVVCAGLVLVPDACQAVLMGALRGQSDVWPPTLLFMLAFWVVMVPAGYALSIVGGHGAGGLLIAICVGCLVASLTLAVRFHLRTHT